MELSILLAKILSLLYLAAAVGALSSGAHYDKVFEDFTKSQGLTFLTGFIGLVSGALMVEYHNVWVKGWPVLITVIGWIALVKGLSLIAFPGMLPSFKPIFKNTKYFGFLVLALGLLFGYFGFVV